MPGSRQNLHHRRGYTLIELVLVMALLALIAGLAAPHLRNFVRGREVGDAATQFVAVGRWARLQAVSRGVPFRLNVDVAGKSYWVTVQQGATFASPGEEFGRTFTIPATIRFDCDFQQHPDGAYVEFEPTGRTDEGNVRLTSATGEVVQIGCQSNTDEFRIYPPGQQVAWGVPHSAKFVIGGQN